MSTVAPSPATATTTALQDSLVELIDLALQAKQYHWNVVGPHFRAVHLQLDEITDAVRINYDDVAERMAALKVAPDGRAATVAGATPLPEAGSGWQRDAAAAEAMAERLAIVSTRLRGERWRSATRTSSPRACSWRSVPASRSRPGCCAPRSSDPPSLTARRRDCRAGGAAPLRRPARDPSPRGPARSARGDGRPPVGRRDRPAPRGGRDGDPPGEPLPRPRVARDAGVLLVADAGPGAARYELAGTWHHHLVCRSCGDGRRRPVRRGDATMPRARPARRRRRRGPGHLPRHLRHLRRPPLIADRDGSGRLGCAATGPCRGRTVPLGCRLAV